MSSRVSRTGFAIPSRSRASIAAYVIVAAAAAVIVAALIFAFGRGSDDVPLSIPRTTVTFPVLWAGQDGQGVPTGGIERARVTVQSMSDPKFDVDLATIKAQGAGEQWVASSAAAATVATLLTGADPQTVDVSYAITGPIDGPSGGAALTVATIAAIRGDEVRPGVTMTGTISPDGTIGTVGGVPTKIRAAASKGYDTVLIPFGNAREVNPETGSVEDMVALGRTLGVRVIRAGTVGEAYKRIAGTSLAPPVTSDPGLDGPAQAVAAMTTRRLAKHLSTMLADGATVIPAPAIPGLRAQVARVGSALAGGSFAVAYGLGVDAAYNIARARARATMTSIIDEKGAPGARAYLAGRIDALSRKARAMMGRDSDPSGLSLDQQLALPAALGWAAYSSAILEGTRAFLSQQRPDATEPLVQSAMVIADIEPSLDIFGPDAIAVIRASRGRSGATPSQTAEFMSGYSDFLYRAGEANKNLYASLTRGARGAGTAGDTYLPVEALSKELSGGELEGIDSLQSEIIQLTKTTTYYLLGTVLVSGQSFGLSGFGYGSDPTSFSGTTDLLRASVAEASASAFAWEGYLQWAGFNMGYSVWSSRWGRATFAALRGTDREEAGAAIALEQLWSDSLTSLITRAAERHITY